MTAAALGIESARGALLAVAAARALAAWLDLDEVLAKYPVSSDHVSSAR